MTSHVKLILPATPGGEVVEIDGHDVTNAVRHVTVEAGVRERFVTIQLGMVGAEYDGIQQLFLSAAQVGLLARFGWQPPAGYEMNDRGDVLLTRLADPNDPRGDRVSAGESIQKEPSDD